MKLGTLRNPKFLRLARRLDTGKAAAAGHLEALWQFAAEQAPAGDVGRWDDADIEEACFWEGEPGALVAALVAEKWLDECQDHRLIVHDWADHTSEMVKKRNRRAQIDFAEPNPPNRANLLREDEHSATAPDGSRTADNGGRTADHQTRPDQTPPDQTKACGAGRRPLSEISEPAPAKPDPWDWVNPKLIDKPDRFQGEAKQRILEWAERRGHSRRVLNEALEVWEEWTEPVGGKKRRTVKSWVGSFQRMVRTELESGRIVRETDDEKYQRELASSPFRLVTGGAADA